MAAEAAVGRETVSFPLSPQSRIELTVISSTGSTIPGALITVTGGGKIEETASSDERGAGVVHAAVGDELEVSKAGFSTSNVRFVAEVPKSQTIVLIAESEIVGKVVGGDGLPPINSVRVLAWELSSDPDGLQAARRAVVGNSAALLTATAVNGEFRFDGLKPSTAYVVAVGGGGYLQIQPKMVVRPGCATITMNALRGYGARVRLLDPSGLPFRLEAFSPGGVNYETGSTMARARPYPIESPSAILAGVDFNSAASNDVTWSFLFTAEGDLKQLPCYLTVTIPGHPLVRQDLSANWIVDSPIESEVRVPDGTSLLGSARLVFRRVSDGHMVRAESRPAGVLRLWGDALPSLNLGVQQGAPGEYAIEGVPYGKYNYRFDALHSDLSFPAPGSEPRTVDIGKQASEIDVDMPSCGVLRCVIRKKDGSLYEGEAVLSMGVGAAKELPADAPIPGKDQFPNSIMREIKHASSRHFEAAPYRIESMPAGSYYLRLDKPFVAHLPGANGVAVIADGSETVVEFIEP